MWIDFDKRCLYLSVIYFKIPIITSFATLVPDYSNILMLFALDILYFIDCEDAASFGDVIDQWKCLLVVCSPFLCCSFRLSKYLVCQHVATCLMEDIL